MPLSLQLVPFANQEIDLQLPQQVSLIGPVRVLGRESGSVNELPRS